VGIGLTVKCRNCKICGVAFSLSPVPPRTTHSPSAMSELDADLYGGEFVVLLADIANIYILPEQISMAPRI